MSQISCSSAVLLISVCTLMKSFNTSLCLRLPLCGVFYCPSMHQCQPPFPTGSWFMNRSLACHYCLQQEALMSNPSAGESPHVLRYHEYYSDILWPAAPQIYKKHWKTMHFNVALNFRLFHSGWRVICLAVTWPTFWCSCKCMQSRSTNVIKLSGLLVSKKQHWCHLATGDFLCQAPGCISTVFLSRLLQYFQTISHWCLIQFRLAASAPELHIRDMTSRVGSLSV